MSGRRLAKIGFADFGTYVERMTLSGKNTAEGKFLIEGVAGVSHADIVGCEKVADLTFTRSVCRGQEFREDWRDFIPQCLKNII